MNGNDDSDFSGDDEDYKIIIKDDDDQDQITRNQVCSKNVNKYRNKLYIQLKL